MPSLFTKKTYDLQTRHSFETLTVFGNFLTLRKNYRALSQVVFNGETRLWESSLGKRPQHTYAEDINGFWKSFDRFLELLCV